MIAIQQFSSFRYDVCSVDISKAVCTLDNSAGGDRADVLEGPDGRIHLITVDACGHGTAAAGLADSVLFTIRALLLRGLTPATVFTLVNRLLSDGYLHDSDTSFGSGIIMSLEPCQRVLTYASAGHVDGLQFTHDGKRHSHHPPTGPLFGIVPDAQYSDEVSPYLPGDAFVLVTDGLTDARPCNTDTELLGTEGICRIVQDDLRSAAGTSAERIISTVRHIAGGAFKDDVAAIVASTYPNS